MIKYDLSDAMKEIIKLKKIIAELNARCEKQARSISLLLKGNENGMES